MDIQSKADRYTQHGVQQQIPRNSLILIMLAQAAVVIPHVNQLSFWIIILGLACAYWRWMIFRDRWHFPPWWLKAALICGSATIILFTEGIQHRLETWTSFLIVAFALKLIETKSRRDAYAVLFLACFVIATEFIYKQTILISLYQSAALIMVVAAMVGMNQFHDDVNIVSAIKTAGKLLAQAIPLMLVLFLFFPRITPFWSVPTASTARTGLSSAMTPGDIAQLTRSDEIAFRAVFEGPPPSTQDLYWRGLVYSNYLDGTWSVGSFPFSQRTLKRIDWTDDDLISPFRPDVKGLRKISYQILQEPTDKIWQFGIDLAIPRDGNNGLTWDFRLISKKPMSTLTRYAINSYPGAVLDSTLPDWSRRRETTLPLQDNPRIVAYAKELYKNAASDQAFIKQLLQEIRKQNFRYTLRPPVLARNNSVDQFWFNTQAGFCMHYAGALTYMLRAVDIPARIVGGYQGGEINPVTGHVIVRQYLAHAWVEAWIPGKGWLRFDPTAAIAPERIEQGFEAAVTEDERDSLSIFTNARLGKMLLAARMLYLFESLEHRWNMFVVGYDAKRQSNTLQKILGDVTPLRVALVLLIGGGISFALAGLSLLFFRKKKPVHPVIRVFMRFTNDLSKKGVNRRPHESPMQFIHRICTHKNLNEEQFNLVIDRLQTNLYDPRSPLNKFELNTLRKELAQLKQVLLSV